MSRIFTQLVFLIITTSLFSQSNTVNTFNFESTTRDTVVTFPTADNNSYERILMHYTMRCKDGLVSTGSNRNLGCGEWDYSCNTYVVDSTRVDSLMAVSDEYNFPGFSEDVFNYSNSPTYSYTQSEKQHVIYNSTIVEFENPLADANDVSDFNFATDGSSMQMAYLVTSAFLEDNDMDRISGIQFKIESGTSTLKNVKVNIAETEEVTTTDALNSDLEWLLVVNDNYTLDPDNNLLRFHEDFRWDDESNIVIQISYDQATGNAFTLNSEDFGSSTSVITNSQDENYKSFSRGGKIRINKPFENISQEITISYWLNGSDSQPVNSTSLEGNDANNVRQVNIHHPWSNGQIYWDCGNDGSGYDRINKPADNETDYKNKWNHWAFTKNATTGIMNIYLNGELWHTGTDKFKAIDLNALNIGGNIVNNNLPYLGSMDEVRVWNSELDQQTIKDYMHKSIDDSHPMRSNLMLYYDFNEDADMITDLSGNDKDGEVDGFIITRKWNIDEFSFDRSESNFLPNHSLIKGIYTKDVEFVSVLDSMVNFPQLINHYRINGTDLELVWSDLFYEAKDYPILDESGNVVGTRSTDIDGSYVRGSLDYFAKVPMAFEIMSFVTPYGIGLDFGLDGLTWTFDVTDFGPILKGDKRIYMTAGGQWQEDMDIKFEFIDGTPDRDVIDITQIWPVRSTGYQSILDNSRYEPRQFEYDPSVSGYVIRTAITGHGQEGEFIPRNHSINVAGFTDTWSVWKDCGENPVYPQGGTWVYDRAGWCPGMATDVRSFDVSQYFEFAENPVVDYTISTASGDSRYYVNSQLIQYGPPNKMHDAGIVDIVNPTSNIVHGRFNPNCSSPIITLKNHGAEALREAKIIYGIVGISELEYDWSGNIAFLGEQQIELPAGINLTLGGSGSEFFARVEMNDDEDDNNDELITNIFEADHYTGDIIIEMRTNNVSNETSYTVEDVDGTVIHQRSGPSLSNNTTYRDTLKNINGCYNLIVTDTGSDGLSWWANNDGNGYIRVKQEGEAWNSIATDFGALLRYSFTSRLISSTNDLDLVDNVKLYPNPGHDNIILSSLDGWDKDIKLMISDASGKLISQRTHQRINLSNRPIQELENLDPGVYFVNIIDSQKMASLRFIKM